MAIEKVYYVRCDGTVPEAGGDRQCTSFILDTEVKDCWEHQLPADAKEARTHARAYGWWRVKDKTYVGDPNPAVWLDLCPDCAGLRAKEGRLV